MKFFGSEKDKVAFALALAMYLMGLVTGLFLANIVWDLVR